MVILHNHNGLLPSVVISMASSFMLRRQRQRLQSREVNKTLYEHYIIDSNALNAWRSRKTGFSLSTLSVERVTAIVGGGNHHVITK